MAKSNSTATSTQYRLPEACRQAILAYSDNPEGHINGARLKVIARQRLKFVQKHGCDGTAISS